MIAFVHGMAVDMTESSVVVEAGGIGYEIYMTGADLSEIRMGEDVKVHTYFSVREDAMKLYGFRAKDDLQMFKLLLGVNGVGPKAALGVLAGITADELRFAILSDDVKTLSKAPGIGKKTAQKLILELKDKMKLEDAFELKLAHEQERAAVGAGEVSDGRQEAVIITTDVTEEDFSLEGNLRPQTLDDYIGQEKTKSTLKVYIEAAKQRHDALDHVLFYGPPGLGKTTLSGIIANEMGVHMKVTSGPAIEKPGEMAAILNNLQEGDILFVDEIHRLNRQVEEVLYPAMEDYAIDIMIGKGASARSIRLDLPKFTLVGATTRAGLLSAPLRDRFGVMHHLEFYTHEELKTIIIRSAQVLGVEIDEKGAAEIAKRSRGTPRLANRLLKRVRDFAQVKYDGRITYDVACFALNLLEVDQYGLDKIDRRILQTMIVNFQGGPVGLETLAAAIGEDSGTLEDVYEPYLLQNGFLNRTPRGRMASALAYEHLGYQMPEKN